MDNTVITITTDFGLSDGYLAAVKGVILSINRQANVVDIAHNIPPQNIGHAAFVLNSAYKFFPENTIHIVVVDPGVGTDRKALLLVTSNGMFIAPDNGVLSHVLIENGIILPSNKEFLEPLIVEVPLNCEAYELNNSKYWLDIVSNTFHGRDIFAPTAAYLSLGISLTVLGKSIDNMVCLNIPNPIIKDNRLVGQVIHVDYFGNLITNIKGDYLINKNPIIEIKGFSIEGLSKSYSDQGEIVAIIGSSGFLEISSTNTSASARLNIGVGEELRLYID